jgi:ABC-type transport system involved in multi-copper enzyme maturation permease subunit
MLGPVFQAELLTTARRARYYAIRAIYVMAILCVLWSSYESTFGFASTGASTFPVSYMTQFARQLFSSFAVTQAITVLAITPALVAGTIATEKQRKTLHYLLGSQLTSREIVIGKLAARLLHVVVFLALGIPVFALLGLFGGVDYWLILNVYVATCVGVFFLSSIGMIASVHAKRGRDALFLAYGLILAWLIVPPIVAALLGLLWPEAAEAVSQFAVLLYPGAGLIYSQIGATSPPNSLLARIPTEALYAWSLSYLVLIACILICIAAARLRPLAARQENKPRLVIGLDNRGRRQYRVLPRPVCFEHDPMLWKERYVSRLGGLARLATAFAGLFLLTLIGCIAFEVIKDSVREMWWGGFLPRGISKARQEMNHFVRSVNASVFCLWLVCTAASAASSISGEREEDTWVSLTSTTLTGREILRAKRWGAIVRYRLLGYTMAVLAILALVTGAVHPLGIVATTIVCAVVLSFTAAFGTYVSLRSKTTLRALSFTILPLIFLNGGYFLCCVPLPRGSLSDMADAAIPARQVWASFYSYQDLELLSAAAAQQQAGGQPPLFVYNQDDWSSPRWGEQLGWFLGFYVVIVPLYALGGRWFRGRALASFPRAAGRPTRPGTESELEDTTDGPARIVTKPQPVPDLADVLSS